MAVSIVWTGTEEFADRLRSNADELNAVSDRTVADFAKKLKETAAAEAPRASGTLAGSLTVETWVWQQGTKRAVYGAMRVTAPYARWVEFGTESNKPRPMPDWRPGKPFRQWCDSKGITNPYWVARSIGGFKALENFGGRIRGRGKLAALSRSAALLQGKDEFTTRWTAKQRKGESLRYDNRPGQRRFVMMTSQGAFGAMAHPFLYPSFWGSDPEFLETLEQNFEDFVQRWSQ